MEANVLYDTIFLFKFLSFKNWCDQMDIMRIWEYDAIMYLLSLSIQLGFPTWRYNIQYERLINIVYDNIQMCIT